ncbi:MAG TPA: MmcQ/YjbR family DNA-binding protein [Actinocrinis sp.]|uniref:MmcQ/YjbR family DNA-binding protein n=1 Tax=Actinocrinis sp. TaxID=1920516 RepID=UPI002DDCDB8E|nr:MmcQ/YjbR family DNA-binding protein [Actinocrinis sp.]HEV2342829.1 MmcQ/YjbR family DNA-binding protein [Actinocrinis sp.]
MATWEDVRRIALGLPETFERTSWGSLGWRVKHRESGKLFVWERPLGKRDREQLGDAAPDGPILGVRVPDLGAKDAVLASDPDVYFTIPHFGGYPAVLVRLDRIDVAALEELVVEAWLCRAAKSAVKRYLAEHPL